MTETRTPIPAGTVSTIRGHWQAPALRLATVVVLTLSVAATLLPGAVGRGLASTAVGLTMAAPLLRVCWLIWRWWQERDGRFIAVGVALLVVVGSGAGLAAAGVGG